MESNSILGYFLDKTILVTGATGFLAMVFVEKILRVQPDVKKIYLLVRATDSKSATARMHDEMIGKELFRVLREKCGSKFDSFILEKVVAVPGDVSLENLGVTLREEMYKEVEIILNSAGTTNFDERYDIALAVNTFGVEHVLSFAKKCLKLEILVHVSTAYVCGQMAGLILEDTSCTFELVKETSEFDLHVVEKNLLEEKLNELNAQDTSEKVISNTIKDFGIERAKLYGWPNTYVFTKAMGEVILERSKDIVPVAIIRPTIVTSTYEEPFPGWVQGLRTIDAVIAGYGKGKLECVLMDPMSVIDMIPVDMLVNAIILGMAANANQSSNCKIYHVGSSFRNPVNFSKIHDLLLRYFTASPWIHKEGEPVMVRRARVFKTLATFRIFMQLRYKLPLEALKFVNTVFGQHFQDIYVNNNQKFKVAMRMAELYEPYMLFKGIFDDTNTEELRRIKRESYYDIEAENFSFDPKCIDWEDYLMRTHIPGLHKHVLMKRLKYSSAGP